MSPTQQKVMQYLPVVFAVFQIFFVTALVVYYIFQTLLRILQQYYITRRFYGHDEALGRQAQRASEAAREEAKKSGQSTGLFGDMKRQLDEARGVEPEPKKKPSGGSGGRPTGSSKRVTPSKSAKNRPAAGASSGGGKGRPTPSRSDAQQRKRPNSKRPQSAKKNKKK